MSIFTAVPQQPSPFVAVAPPLAPGFAPGMTGKQLLAIIFRTCRELGVSDIQMRSQRPVYVHTHRGMEKLAEKKTYQANIAMSDSFRRLIVRSMSMTTMPIGA